MQKYICRVCGYIYVPEEGEPRRKTDPGTDFKDLPNLWRCPVCGAGKIKFDETK